MRRGWLEIIVILTFSLSFSLFSFAALENSTESLESESIHQSYLKQYILETFQKIDFGKSKPVSFEVFEKAYLGYLNLEESAQLPNKKNILSIADYSLSANQKRFWVIDLKQNKLLFHSLLAHGQGTGEEMATKFSNIEGSHQTSLGFFITGATYQGSNGYSLYLHGKDKNYNDNALQRAIVIHGAPYVSNEFIRANKRLGRSWGCPAVPLELAKPIIDCIKDGSCFFAYYPEKKYLTTSIWLSKTPKFESKLIKEKLTNALAEKPFNEVILDKPTENEANAMPDNAKEKRASYNGVFLNTSSSTY